MATRGFDEAFLRSQLDGLSKERRAVFAAACAERLLPAYDRFALEAGRGDPKALRKALTRLWDDLTGNPMTEFELRASAKMCSALVPTEDDEGAALADSQSSAEDAAAALVFALDSRWTERSQEALWSARRAYDALDHFVMRGQPGILVTPTIEQRVLTHPLVQAEFERQRRDLDELIGSQSQDVTEVARLFRDRAAAEGRLFFGEVSR